MMANWTNTSSVLLQQRENNARDDGQLDQYV
jgi:hypothetical protein